ncbi:MAG: L,D-transpeptidase [Limnoraphis robusta]|jgi:lipoprotein-anchoring transpeptidase ErfK/SrfK|uniref:ErfK/YbiS/YcfS/YnhG family protein n=2 Tax=Limnoraphis robusta TaxID=1118279 RepID=A0A0F5Y7S9_9CYAN|nr:L,D-transpeptidase [Limnoraphis robusta]MCG5057078.1 L,D-transpeptidase [Limnoraphis sp. WC205]KKD35001.1 ErfK/YbiS/YcfS/YnhG family protein [Limnoraphis robusta CS-951]MEA5501322.1 L,D-transpeptidase [Limnoraphis robusta BA-68 BA1]MEA5519012.1 L,D-transpeptidase [Limnoraphis robusta CCNP1315]MEA5539462.1 L,D-transpeptidase [Limnoraphis robusta Tam1]
MVFKVNNQNRFQRFIRVGLSALMVSVIVQSGVSASTPNNTKVAQGTSARTSVIPSQLLNPILPGLDDPSIFLPSGKPKMRLVLRLGQRRVFVYRNDQQVASYPVAVGKAGWETPTGQFKVIQMVENPVWQNPWTGEVRPPGPDSALGLRWIGFWTDGKDTIGFHGTPTINSIGQAASHGCVRMRNEDVVALFNQVEMGTLVVVEP